ncbi:hypothetical protein [Paraburkholderia lacunae]|uniref:hypothetical protein n=1 Tax=Paraburkholderia lacunae TaxID=2211104 RepID=UPI000E0F6FEA|nr:hypothetical protein [Paraburkholderia lacunae]
MSLEFKLVVFVILVAVCEGAARKWFLPALTSPLLACRDLAALTLVLRAAMQHRFRAMPMLSQCLVLWSFCVVIWGALQLVVVQGPVVLYFLGLRFWLLYLWFALAMACSLSANEVIRIIRLMIVLSVLMMPLAVLQHFLPPSSALNVQPDTDEEEIFRVSTNIVRVSGTFTFTMGYACFIAAVAPFAMSTVWNGMRLYRRKWFALVAFFAVSIGTLISGSRASIMFFGALLAIQTVGSVVGAKSGKALIFSLAKALIAAAALTATLFVFSDALVATQERFTNAAAEEDVLGRVETELLGEPAALKDMNFIGHGLGAGTNAGSVLLTGERTFELAESEPARVLLEMGLVGVAWLLIKCTIFSFGLAKSVGRLTRLGETLPSMLWATAAYGMSSWPVSGQVSANAFGYIVLGLALCSIRPAVPARTVVYRYAAEVSK